MNLKKSQFPFRVHKFPVFYGWIILVAATIGVIASIPGQTMGVSVFTDYLIDALHIERTNLTLAYLIGTIASGLLITRAGKYYDKYGARIMAMGSGFMLGFILLGFAKIDKLVEWFAQHIASVPISAFTMLFLVLAFFGIRFFGQGVLTMVSRNMLMKWFEKRRGLANAISGVFVSFGFSFSPRIFQYLIDGAGWRGAWIEIGVVLMIGFALFALFFFRDNAVDSGLQPDGGWVSKKAKSRNTKYKPERDFTLKEATKTYSFWIFNLTLALNALYVTAITLNIVSIFGEANLDSTVAISIFLPISVIAVIINFIGGWLSDFIRLKYLVMVNMFGIALSAIGVVFLGDTGNAFYAIIVGNGIMSGIFSVLNSVVWPRFYGTKHLGAISGYSMSWTVIGSALGPYLYSLSLKYADSYSISSVICIAIAIALFVASFKANNINASPVGH